MNRCKLAGGPDAPTTKTLARGNQFAYVFHAQFRTCLWPCVDRWASGQEAGQPPKEAPTSLLTRPAFANWLRRVRKPAKTSCDGGLMRSAAGGETGAPRSPRGTRLKATTERAFLDP